MLWTRSHSVLLVAGVALRLLTWSLVDYRIDTGDASSYLHTAHNLLEFGVYSEETGSPPPLSHLRPPLYATFVAGALAIIDSPWTVRVLQLLVSLVTAFLAARLASRWSERHASWVWGVMMLSPFEAVFTGALLSETMTAVLMLAATTALVATPSLRNVALGGLFAGLTILCRDIYSPLMLAAAGALLLRTSLPLRTRLLHAVVVVVVAIAVIAPWSIRNHGISGRWGLSAGRLGYSLWIGTWAVNDEFTYGDAAGLDRVYPPEAFGSAEEQAKVTPALAPTAERNESDRVLKEVALERLTQHPVRTLGIWFKRAPKLWLGTRFEIFELNKSLLPRGTLQWKAAKGSLWILNALLLLAALAGTVIVLRTRRAELWVLLPIVYSTAVYFPLNSFESRYSQPVMAFVAILAAEALLVAQAKWQARKRTAAVPEPSRSAP